MNIFSVPPPSPETSVGKPAAPRKAIVTRSCESAKQSKNIYPRPPIHPNGINGQTPPVGFSRSINSHRFQTVENGRAPPLFKPASAGLPARRLQTFPSSCRPLPPVESLSPPDSSNPIRSNRA
jgi:hypothetical protein